MKNFIKLISSAALLVLFSLALSSYDVQPVDDPGNGTVVEVFKNEGWVLNACGESTPAAQTTRQMKDGELHMLTLKFELAEDSCLIQDKAGKIEVGTPYGTAMMNVTPSGQAILKLVIN